MPRYTFLVCVSCGVQSPPVVLEDDSPRELSIPLNAMGWRLDRMRFTALATCPECLRVKKKVVEA